MKSFIYYIRTNLIGGLFFIILIFLMIFLIEKIIIIFRKMVAPISDQIHISFFGGAMTTRIITITILILLCLIAGLFAKTKNASRLKDWIEDHILSNILGYTLIKGLTESASGLDSNNLKEVVLVNMEEAWQIGFLMDRIDDDLNAVFIPSAHQIRWLVM